MTYNVHSCKGWDRRLDPERILRVIEASRADVVALQELDVGQTRSLGLDQARFLGERLNMDVHFVAARRCGEGHYGNALLSRLPSKLKRAGCLPQLAKHYEPRAAQWIDVEAPWGSVAVVNAHLALDPRERILQVAELLGGWLDDREMSRGRVLLGDLNTRPGSAEYLCLSRQLSDVQLAIGARRPRATFPAWFPMVRIDHAFVSRALAVRHVAVPGGHAARMASDHRPLVVDVEPGPEAAR
jgi:endonuclease/exonuclease/phosphatase family metal-dependent hydrolase